MAQTVTLERSIMFTVAMGIADGQLAQADSILAGGYDGRRMAGGKQHDSLVRALEHLRAACGWLTSACNAI